jgi:DNA ligase-associated metallophosphoesterase
MTIELNGAEIIADTSGAAFWPTERALLVADLHFEKGSSYAPRGRLLPPYDTRETLARLKEAISRLGVERVYCLGDSTHDETASARLDESDLEVITALTSSLDWVWLRGNHDPSPPESWGGRVMTELSLGPLVLRHEASASPVAGEVSGHYHPKASVRLRGKRVTGRAFLSDGRRLLLPSFGAYTGGLSALDPAIKRLFPKGFTAWLLGRKGIFAFPDRVLVA